MLKINVVFEEDYNDVNIILVSKSVYDNLDVICQQFLDWIPSQTENELFVQRDEKGAEVFICETEGFVWWLNKFYLKNEHAAIVKKHTIYDRTLKSIFF